MRESARRDNYLAFYLNLALARNLLRFGGPRFLLRYRQFAGSNRRKHHEIGGFFPTMAGSLGDTTIG